MFLAFLARELFGFDMQIPDLNGYMSLGYTRFEWEPGFELDDEDALPVFVYSTEGLELVTFRMGLSYRNLDFLRFLYERPMARTDYQEEMLLAHQKTKVQSLETILFGVSLGSFADFLGIYNRFTWGNWLYSVLLSTEYQRTVSRFYGEARAKQDMFFVDSKNNVTSFDEGDKMTFSSTITTNEVTVDLLGGWLAGFGTDFIVWDPYAAALEIGLLEFMIIMLVRAPQLRIGYFQTTYHRPTAFRHDIRAQDGRSVTFAAEYEASGYVIGFRRARRDLNGFNLDISHRRSTDAHITAYYTPNSSDLEYSATIFDMWYQLPFNLLS